MVRWLRAAVVSLALAAMIASAGVVLGRIYAGPLLVQLVAGAALGSVGAGALARRLPGWTVAPLSVLLLAGYTIVALRLAAARADLTGPTPAIIRDALVNGIPRLLTAMIPVEPTPDTVVVPVIAAWLAGLAGTEIAVRAGRVLLGLVPAAVLYAGALYVVGPNAGPAIRPTLAFAALAVVALAVSTRPGAATAPAGVPVKTRAFVRGRALAGTAAGLIVVLGLVAAVGPWVGGRVVASPADPRRYVQPPRVDSLDESPLNRISGWALSPKQRLLDVGPATVDDRTGNDDLATVGDQAGEVEPSALGRRARSVRLRLAVLPDYDGVTWRVGATYRNAGRVLPPQPLLPDASVHRVRQVITVDGLTGRLLPVVPTPTGVSGARVAFDASTGTLLRPEGLTVGLRYSVTSAVQDPDPNLLPTADTPSGAAVARYLAVGTGVPPQIQRLADQLATDNGAAYDRAAAIEAFLADHYRQVSDAPSGHAYPNLAYFLFGPRRQGGQVGTSEQFAASFALLARLTGLPSRVVVGFDAPAAGGTVTGADAIAWPEILFDDLGWVAFDPMPKTKDPRPVEEDFLPKSATPPPAPSESSTPTATATVSTAPVAAPARAGGPPAALVAGAASGSVLLMLVAAAGAVVLSRRSLRRRRLTTGGPDERIVGAWAEFTDALRLAGRPVPVHLAATEAAAHAAAQPAAPTRSPSRRLLRRSSPGSAEMKRSGSAERIALGLLEAHALGSVEADVRGAAEAGVSGLPGAHALGSGEAEGRGSAEANASGLPEANAQGWAEANAQGWAEANALGWAEAEGRGSAEAGVSGLPGTNALGSAEADVRGAAEADVPGLPKAQALGAAEAEGRGSARADAWGSAGANALGAPEANGLGSAEASALGAAAVEVRGSAEAVVSGLPEANAHGLAGASALGSAEADASGLPEANALDSAEANASGSQEWNAQGLAGAGASALGSAEADASGLPEVKAPNAAEAHALGSAETKASGLAETKALGLAEVRALGSPGFKASGSATANTWGSMELSPAESQADRSSMRTGTGSPASRPCAGSRTGGGFRVGKIVGGTGDKRRHVPPIPDDQSPLPPLGELVTGINTVGFAPGAADDAQARRAGEQAVAFATALRDRRPWWRRLWWTVHPGPLHWRRRSR